MGQIGPSRDIPVLLWDDFEETSRIGGVRSLFLELFREIVNAEEDPVVQVAVVKVVLDLLDTEKGSRKVGLANNCHQGGSERGISRGGQGRATNKEGEVKKGDSPCPPESEARDFCHGKREGRVEC